MKIEFQVKFRADISNGTLVELFLLIVRAYLGQ